MPRPKYLLATRVAIQLEEILFSLAEHSGWERSMALEERLYKAFDDIGSNPGVGHLRQDLVSDPIYFYFSEPYQILFLRDTDPITIIAIFHSSRDVRALMQREE